jgi:hypothetical protein
MSLTRPQTAILHVAKAKLALDDETYRQVLVRLSASLSRFASKPLPVA